MTHGYRIGRAFPGDEIARRLRGLDAADVAFTERPHDLVPARGWNELSSEAVIARERPGPPPPDGAFARARVALERFQHSDPRVVVAHLDPAVPLRGRPVLLELKALGLRFLGPVVVRDVREDVTSGRTTFAYCIDTLRGHVVHGREWFVLAQDHRSGEVRLRIQAAWRPGDLPGRWARLGLALVGRRRQRAWHRLAIHRLRRFAGVGALAPPRDADGVAHAGTSAPLGPVRLYARRAAGARRAAVEREEETAAGRRWWTVAGLGAVAGVRSLLPLALLAIARGHPARIALAPLAAGELLADKVPGMPSRVAPLALAGRVLSGAAVGAALARRGERRLPAIVGAAAALAAAFASVRARTAAARWLPPAMAAVAEDLLALSAGAALARR